MSPSGVLPLWFLFFPPFVMVLTRHYLSVVTSSFLWARTGEEPCLVRCLWCQCYPCITLDSESLIGNNNLLSSEKLLSGVVKQTGKRCYSAYWESHERERVCVENDRIQRTRKGGGRVEQTGCGQSQTDLSVREHTDRYWMSLIVLGEWNCWLVKWCGIWIFYLSLPLIALLSDCFPLESLFREERLK